MFTFLLSLCNPIQSVGIGFVPLSALLWIIALIAVGELLGENTKKSSVLFDALNLFTQANKL
jgi:hypothetical protein